MIFCRFDAGHGAQYGLVEHHNIQPIIGDIFTTYELDGESIPFGAVRLLAPVEPSKIVGIGLNYKAHAQELNFNTLTVPTLFLKPPTTVIAQQEKIICPAMSQQVEFEAELAVVIGKLAKDVPQDQALNHVLGYTCLNDVTARDLQRSDGQWTRAKGFDTFSPMGPWIVTDLDPANVQIESYLNGVLKQNANTSEMIFSIPQIIAFVSQVMTLYPGDVITTGTPAGVAALKKGDTIDVRIDGVGILRNYVD